MKNLITTIGSMIILFIFLMQFVANQMTYTKLLGTEMTIKNFRRDVEVAGHIQERNIEQMKETVSKLAKCNPDDVLVEFQSDTQGKIEYNVSVPIGDVIGASKLLQLNEEENRFQYNSKGVIFMSEEDEKPQEEGAS